jgi:hypothetical protein
MHSTRMYVSYNTGYFLQLLGKYSLLCITACTLPVKGSSQLWSYDRVPRVQASSQDNGSRLPAKGSSEAVMCPRGSGSRSRLGAAPGPPRAPAAGDSTEAATCPRGSGQLRGCHVSLGLQHPPSGVGQLRSCHMSPGLCGLQANKQISHGDPAIIISIGAGTPIPSKALRGKGCSARSQGVQQAAH